MPDISVKKADTKENASKKSQDVDICMLEEDDEFEEFAPHAYQMSPTLATTNEYNNIESMQIDTTNNNVGSTTPPSDLIEQTQKLTITDSQYQRNELTSSNDIDHNEESNDIGLIVVPSGSYWRQAYIPDHEADRLPTDHLDEFSDNSSTSDGGYSLSSSCSEIERKFQPFLLHHNQDQQTGSDSSSSDDEDDENRARSSQFSRRQPGKLGQSRKASLASTIARQRAERARKQLIKRQVTKREKYKQSSSSADHHHQKWAPGELVWAHSPHQLPWWPCIVLHQPRRGGQLLHPFKIKLRPLGPSPPTDSLTVLADQLRLYKGREEFDRFLKSSIVEAKNRFEALARFSIQPSLQQAWEAARSIADALKMARPEPSGRLGLAIASTRPQHVSATTDGDVKQDFADFYVKGRFEQSQQLLRRDWSDSSCSDDDDNDSMGDSMSSATLAAASTTETIADKQSKTTKSSSYHFEFETLDFLQPNTSPRIFLCGVCGSPGLPGPSPSTLTELKQLTSSSSTTTNPSPPQFTMATTNLPLLFACIGQCGAYLHASCIEPLTLPPQQQSHHNDHHPATDDDQGSEANAKDDTTINDDKATSGERCSNQLSIGLACSFCRAGKRQCYICLKSHLVVKTTKAIAIGGSNDNVEVDETHVSDNKVTSRQVTLTSKTADDQSAAVLTQCSTAPPALLALLGCVNASSLSPVHEDGGQGQVMLRCSIRACRRWYHSACLHQPPFASVVVDRRSNTFQCPSHTCLACVAESPGTRPRPSKRYVRCLLCPAAYHPGDWCIPAGSVQIAFNWIICPRHASADWRRLVESAIGLSSQSSITANLHPSPAANILSALFTPPNVPWCFICSKGGRIMCCESCPASFHEECLKIDEVPEKFICEDCTNCRQPRLGEIVWARLPPATSSKPITASSIQSTVSGVNWWPGEILHPRSLGALLNDPLTFHHHHSSTTTTGSTASLPPGLFVVRLFGLGEDGDSRVLITITKSRLFPFEEGDDKRNRSSSSSSSSDEVPRQGRRKLDVKKKRRGRCRQARSNNSSSSSSSLSDDEDDPLLVAVQHQRPTFNRTQVNKMRLKHRLQLPDDAYSRAVKKAAEGWAARRVKFAQLLGRTRRPDYYKPIKINYPVGSVRVLRLTDLSEALKCECNPVKSKDPCGVTSSCINRELHYECLPAVCPNGEACKNQCFTKRLYPKQRAFWTGEKRGWGLKTLEPIVCGTFVNEYIGDLIDEEEANRRLRFAHENNITNYYMMKLDAQRIIDAGPKGNLSRFANHSCDPNLNTQKWTVNGEDRIGLFAVRDIKTGEELTFNYNFVALGQDRLTCCCQAANCTGLLGVPTPAAATTSTNHGGSKVATTGGRGPDVRVTTNGGSLRSPAVVSGGDGACSATTIKSSRHEDRCFRCKKRLPPPTSFQSTDPSVTNSNNGRQPVKPRKRSPPANNQLVYCGKSDCPKAYHPICLDLESVPIIGRSSWYCPWHSCDACGRASLVFCLLCTSSFCMAHADGSLLLLPPDPTTSSPSTTTALIVCMSHPDEVETISRLTNHAPLTLSRGDQKNDDRRQDEDSSQASESHRRHSLRISSSCRGQ